MIQQRVLMFYLSLITMSVDIFGQELRISDLHEVPDSSAKVEFAKDINGKPCSLLRIYAKSISNLTFSGMIIGDVKEISNGVYLLNIAERTKRINYKHVDYLPGTIDFSTFNISVKGERVYSATLEPDIKNKENTSKKTLQYLIFKFDKPIEKIVVNDVEWPVFNNQSKKLVREGKYEYTVNSKEGRIKRGMIEVGNQGVSKVVKIKF